MKKIIFLFHFLVLVLLAKVSNAQVNVNGVIVTATGLNDPAEAGKYKLYTCEEQSLSLVLNNTTGSDVSDFEIAFPSSDILILYSYISNANVIADAANHKVKIGTLVPGVTTISIPIKASCNYFNSSSNPSLTSLQISYAKGLATQALNFNIYTGVLDYVYQDDAQDNTSYFGHRNDVFKRRYNLKTTLNQLYGVFRLEEMVPVDISIISIIAKINGQQVYSITAPTVDPVTHKILLTIPIAANGILSNSDVEFIETVKIIGCPSTKGHMIISSGCEDTYCKIIREMDVVTNQGPEKPILILQEVNPKEFSTCLNGVQNEVTREFKLTNTGDADALEVYLPFHTGANYPGFPLTIVPEAYFSVSASDPTNTIITTAYSLVKTLGEVRNNTTSMIGQGFCFEDNLSIIANKVFTIPILKKGEHILFTWKERTCCVSSDDNSYNMFPSGFQTYNHTNECGGSTYVGWVNTNDDAVLVPLSQIELSGTNNMFGCTDCGGAPGCFGNPSGNCSALTLNNPAATTDYTEELRIRNSSLRITGNNANYGFLPIDMNRFRLVVDVVAEGRLLLAPQAFPGATAADGNIRLIDQSGILVAGSPRIFLPVSQSSLTNTQMLTSFGAADAPVGARAIFEINIHDVFDEGQIQQYAVDGYKNGAYQKAITNFINALEVRFELSARCDKSPTNLGRSPYHEKIYLMPDNTCNDCMLSIGSYNDAIIVNCPGCQYPGVLTTGYSIERVTVGLSDGDNNGLPDNISNTINGPNLKMVTDDDVFKATTTSSLWSGSFRTYGSGGNIGSLEQETALGFANRFLTNLGRIDFISPYGNQFIVQVDNQHPITLKYTQGSNTYKLEFYNNSSNIWSSNGSGNFLFQFDISLVRQALQSAYGFTVQQATNFNYESGDQSVITCHYKVLPDFDLGSDYYKGIDVSTRCFYSNQIKDVTKTTESDPQSPYGLSGNYKAADLALMRPYLNYVCEAYGTGFILADLKEKYAFLPGGASSCLTIMLTGYGTQSDLAGINENFDLFPFEVRSLRRTSKINFVLARGYVIDFQRSTLNVAYSHRNSNALNYTKAFQTKSFENIKLNNLNNIRIVGPYIDKGVTIGNLYEVDFEYSPILNYKQNSSLINDYVEEKLDPQRLFTDFNEYGIQWLQLALSPNCTQNPWKTVLYSEDDPYRQSFNFDFINDVYVNVPRATVQSIDPLQGMFNSINQKQWNIITQQGVGFHKPEISVTIGRPVANLDIYKKTQRVPFTVAVSEGNINVFTYFTSSNNKVTFGNLFLNGSTVPYPVINGIYQLGNSFTAGQVIQFELEVHVICNNIINDNLNIHVGYLCDNVYPVLLTNGQLSITPCAISSNSIELIETNVDMSIGYVTTLSTCEKISQALTIKSLQNGGLYDFVANVDLPINLFYLGNPMLAVFHGNGSPMKDPNDPSRNLVFAINSPVVSSGNNLLWDFSALAGLDDVYLSLGDYLLLTFDTKPRCGFFGGNVTASVSSLSYCDKSITRNLPQAYNIIFNANCFPLRVSLSSPSTVCLNENLVLTANVIEGATSGMTFTWYKVVGGIRQLPALFGPSPLNTYTYNNITTSTTFEVELNNGEGCTTSATHTVNLASADQCCTYKLGDITLDCSTATQNICVPLTAVRNVPAGIIGMDFCLKYDPVVMKYTGPTGGTTSSALGTVVTNAGLFGARYAAYNDAINGILRISIYYTGSGTGLASFSGSGQIVCLNFSVPNSTSRQGVFPLAMCSVNDLQEAYTLEEKAACWKAGSLTINSPDLVKGSLRNPLYNNGIIGYSANPTFGYAVTTVTAVGADCDPQNLITPTVILGPAPFSIPTNGFPKIKIKRDIDGIYNPAPITTPPTAPSARREYMKFVNGSDTWKIHRMTTMDPILNQNVASDERRNLYWYAIAAADVNMNGHVRANDISLVQERIISKRDYFPQLWNNGLATSALDWRFVDQTTVLSNGSFKKSVTYPNSDGSGFHRENTPNIPLCLDARKTCNGQIPETYYGIMLGDVYRNSSGQNPGTNPYLRTSTEPSSITIDAKHAQYLGSNIYRVPVMHKYAYEYSDNLFAIDLYMDYNQQKIRVNNVLYTAVTTDGGVSMVWNNADEDEFILTSYATLDSIAGSGICYYLDIEKFTDEPFKKVDFGTLQFLLNGELVEAKVETGETVTGTTDGQSSIKPHVTVIPNPTSGAAMVDFAVSNNSNDNRIIITDVLGRPVKSFEHVQNFGMLDFNTEDLAAGMYIITLKGENGFGLSEKFQVRK